jgi:hypothetical protein
MAFDFRRTCAIVLMTALPAFLASCSSNSLETAAPVTTGDGPDRSMVYPDITSPVTAAAEQMSEEEVLAFSARMDSLASRRRSGAISEAEYRRQVAEMQALRASHGQATLDEIAK